MNGEICQSYLLRLWPIRKEDSCSWQASLQDARTGERYGFKTLRDLFSFVEVKTEEVKE